jgi:hypothetical protein
VQQIADAVGLAVGLHPAYLRRSCRTPDHRRARSVYAAALNMSRGMGRLEIAHALGRVDEGDLAAMIGEAQRRWPAETRWVMEQARIRARYLWSQTK